MSVVNKMLQDLDARTRQSDTSADYQPPPTKSVTPLIGTAVVLALVAVAGSAYVFWPASPPASGSVTQTSPNQRALSVVPVQEAEKARVQTPTVVIEQVAAPLSPATALDENESDLTIQTPVSATPVVSSASPDNSEAPRRDTEASTTTSVEPPPQTNQPQVAVAQVVAQHSPASSQNETTASSVSVPSSSTPQLSAGVLEISTDIDDSSKHLPDLKAQARHALQRGDDATAIALLSQIVTQEPDNINARKRLAALQFSAGHLSDALHILQAGVERAPQQADFRLMLARMFLHQQRSEEALEILEQINVPLTDKAYLSLRASVADNLKQFEIAVRDYRQLLSLEPDNARWWLGLGISLERLAQYPEASHAYQQAHSLQQLSPEVMTFINQRLAFLASRR